MIYALIFLPLLSALAAMLVRPDQRGRQRGQQRQEDQRPDHGVSSLSAES